MLRFNDQTARLVVALARIAYRTQDAAEADLKSLGLTNAAFYTGPSTQAFSATDEERFFLAFRGTESSNHVDWMRDAEFSPVKGVFDTNVHSGFRRAADELFGATLAAAVDSGFPIVTVGHSLGGGLAVLAAARLVESGHPVDAVYTFGQPRVGLRDFASAYESALGGVTFRVINGIDVVTRVPLLIQNYRHVGQRMYFDVSGGFHGHASAWRLAWDDVKTRFSHFGSISRVGVAPHEIHRYVERIDTLA